MQRYNIALVTEVILIETSCRFHFWEKDENGIVMCRDCKRMPSEITSHNCYHISKGNDCCTVCTIS